MFFYFDLEIGDKVFFFIGGRFMGDLLCFLCFLFDFCIVLFFFDFFCLILGFDFFDVMGEGFCEIELYFGIGNCLVFFEVEEIFLYCFFSFLIEFLVLGCFLCFFCLWDDFLFLLWFWVEGFNFFLLWELGILIRSLGWNVIILFI